MLLFHQEFENERILLSIRTKENSQNESSELLILSNSYPFTMMSGKFSHSHILDKKKIVNIKAATLVFVIETPVLQSHVGGDASRVVMISCDAIWFCDAGRVTSYTFIYGR